MSSRPLCCRGLCVFFRPSGNSHIPPDFTPKLRFPLSRQSPPQTRCEWCAASCRLVHHRTSSAASCRISRSGFASARDRHGRSSRRRAPRSLPARVRAGTPRHPCRCPASRVAGIHARHRGPVPFPLSPSGPAPPIGFAGDGAEAPAPQSLRPPACARDGLRCARPATSCRTLRGHHAHAVSPPYQHAQNEHPAPRPSGFFAGPLRGRKKTSPETAPNARLYTNRGINNPFLTPSAALDKRTPIVLQSHAWPWVMNAAGSPWAAAGRFSCAHCY